MGDATVFSIQYLLYYDRRIKWHPFKDLKHQNLEFYSVSDPRGPCAKLVHSSPPWGILSSFHPILPFPGLGSH